MIDESYKPMIGDKLTWKGNGTMMKTEYEVYEVKSNGTAELTDNGDDWFLNGWIVQMYKGSKEYLGEIVKVELKERNE
ncbi:MAG: hypothetical protein K0U20_09240 [Proteobacteria bacterium]|nr:hypothetical protein [Pseudomonadota bacterium]MCH9735765.1 hypothetical protein [Actinomycetes bacterium]